MCPRRQFWNQMLVEQRNWIKEHGETLAGYIRRYGDPGISCSNGRLMCGNGGTAIYNADIAELRRIEGRVIGE